MKDDDSKKFTIGFFNFSSKSSQLYSRRVYMQPARETAGADIPFPLIKETRQMPLRDAEVISTHYTDHERILIT